MRNANRGRIVAMVLGAGLVGYLIGPPIVSAAVGVTKLQHGKKGNQANVKRGRVWVQPMGGKTSVTGSNVFTIPRPTWGVDLIATGTENDTACDADATVTDLVVNGPDSGDFTVIVKGDGLDDDALPNQTFWSAEAAAGEQVAHTFSGGGLFVGSSVLVETSGTPGEWFVYGFCYGTPGGATATSKVSKELTRAR